jgi:hypothetical protein
MDDKETPRQPVRLGRVIAKGFRNAYDHLGFVVLVSFAFFVLISAESLCVGAVARASDALVVRLLVMIPAALLAWLYTTGVYYYVKKSVFDEHPVLADMWIGVRRLAIPAVGLFAVDLVLTGIVFADTVFFIAVFAAKPNIVIAILGALCGYIALMWLMMAMYHLPVMVAQLDMPSGPRVVVVLRKSFLIVADNPAFTVGLFLVIIAFTIVCAVPALVGTALLCLGATAFVLTSALRELFTKYGLVEDEPEIVEERPWKLPAERAAVKTEQPAGMNGDGDA